MFHPSFRIIQLISLSRLERVKGEAVPLCSCFKVYIIVHTVHRCSYSTSLFILIPVLACPLELFVKGSPTTVSMCPGTQLKSSVQLQHCCVQWRCSSITAKGRWASPDCLRLLLSPPCLRTTIETAKHHVRSLP